MANELFKAFMVGSQLVQMSQNMRTNRTLNEIHGHQLNQAQREARLAWLREQIFAIRRNFEMAQGCLENNPARAFYLCEFSFMFCQREGVGTESFPAIDEKEYFHQLWQYGDNIRGQAWARLPAETAEQATAAAYLQAAMHELKSLNVWTEITETLPKNTIYALWQNPVYCGAVTLTCLFFSLSWIPFFLVPVYLWVTNPYPKILPKITALARSIGGSIQGAVVRKQTRLLADACRQKLTTWGLNPPVKPLEIQYYVQHAEGRVNEFLTAYPA